MFSIKILIICSILFLNTFMGVSYANVPHDDSLFKNVSNEAIVGNTVTFKFYIKKTANPGPSLEPKETAPTDALYFKSILFFDQSNKPSFVQILYDDSTMNDKKISNVAFLSNFNSFFRNDKTPVEKIVFYGALSSLLGNYAVPMNSFLEAKYSKFKRKEELLNAQKRRLMDSYKKYLQVIKDEPALAQKVSSPLKPEDDQEKARVNQIMNENLYFNSPNVKLVKKEKDFFWQLDLGGFLALFSNEKKQLYSISIEDRAKFSLYFLDYVLLDGVHELPREIKIQLNESENFELVFTSLSHSSSKLSDFTSLVENAVKAQKEGFSKDKTDKTAEKKSLPFLI